MGTKYTTISISNYNASPPPDDGTQVSANKVDWSKVKTKLGDPLNTAITSINSSLVTHFDQGPTLKTGAYTTTAADYNSVLEVTGTTTITLLAAATGGAGYNVAIKNSGAAVVTVASSDNIDSSASVTIAAKKSAKFIVDAGGTTYHMMYSDDELPAGAITQFAGTSLPTGWLWCNGATGLSTTANPEYAALWAAIGTTYGGTGAADFDLPDLRGRVAAGKDDMGATASQERLTNQSGGVDGDILGDTGGSETHTLTTAQMPEHRHTMGSAVDAGSGSAVRTTKAYSAGGTALRSDYQGSDAAHNNVQPTIILNYIIRY